jgi:hypothetical protein
VGLWLKIVENADCPTFAQKQVNDVGADETSASSDERPLSMCIHVDVLETAVYRNSVSVAAIRGPEQYCQDTDSSFQRSSEIA